MSLPIYLTQFQTSIRIAEGQTYIKMNQEKIDTFILSNKDFFPIDDIPMIRVRMESLDDTKWSLLETLDFKNPQVALMLSIFGGPIGVDRFYIGDYILGVVKTITCGGLLIWAFVDQFLIKKATKENNLKLLMGALNI